MSAVMDKVRSLWIPLRGMNLLLPNVAVAEVVPFREAEAMEKAPDWMLGSLNWRDQRIPVISFESFSGVSTQEDRERSRIIVLNNTLKKGELPFFAMVTSGIPRLFLADEEALDDVLSKDAINNPYANSAVRIGSEVAMIPALETITREVAKAWKRAG